MRFYRCNICGNEIEMILDSGNAPFCCGRVMEEIRPNETDGAKEKHVPVCKLCKGDLSCPDIKKVWVMVGAEPHPMTAEHKISWIIVETDRHIYRKNLAAGQEAAAVFYMHSDEKVQRVYSYCNLHGLWMADCK